MLLPTTKGNRSKLSNRTVDRLIISNKAVRLYSRNLLYKILDPPLICPVGQENLSYPRKICPRCDLQENVSTLILAHVLCSYIACSNIQLDDYLSMCSWQGAS